MRPTGSHPSSDDGEPIASAISTAPGSGRGPHSWERKSLRIISNPIDARSTGIGVLFPSSRRKNVGDHEPSTYAHVELHGAFGTGSIMRGRLRNIDMEVRP